MRRKKKYLGRARYDLNDMIKKGIIFADGGTTARKYKLQQASAKM